MELEVKFRELMQSSPSNLICAEVIPPELKTS